MDLGALLSSWCTHWSSLAWRPALCRGCRRLRGFERGTFSVGSGLRDEVVDQRPREQLLLPTFSSYEDNLSLVPVS